MELVEPIKKEWTPPEIVILDIKNTLGGGATSIEETLGGTVVSISPL
jgi:hypothetical protein